ncbi:MAG TPA: hypothetical protein VGL55_14445 [Steroidobacteraceae bacterium]|jgi:glutamyl-tRNA reductase
MHQIGVVGLSYRHANVDEVARFAVPKADIAARLPALRDSLGVSEVFYVGTCNRVEVLYATADGAPAGDARREVFRALIGREPEPGEASRVLRAWTGEAAVEHLFLVACGLDSAQTGEQEIAAQIRGAWESARLARTCGATLDRVLGEALSMANRVHRIEARKARPPSLGDIAAERVLRHLGEQAPRVALVADGSSPATPIADRSCPVALVGVSPMTRRCGAALHRAGISILVVNRTLPAAEELASAFAGRAMGLDEFRSRPPAVGALVLAAGGTERILDGAALANVAGAAATSVSPAPLLVDLGVPPNADPEAARALGLVRVGMDDLIQAAQERRLTQLMRLAPVRAAIDDRLNHLRSELATRAIGRRLADLREAFEQIAAEETERALESEFSDLDEYQRLRLQRFASTVARRLAHLPLAGLRAAAVHASTDAVDAFFREARLRRRQNK